MSDEEFDYEYSDEEGEGMYSDVEGEAEDDSAILIENAFYEAEDLRNTDPERALEKFIQVDAQEAAMNTEIKWRFKAIRQVCILACRLQKYKQLVESYRKLLQYVDSVTSNESSECLNTILDLVSVSNADNSIAEEMYSITLESLQEGRNERLWFATNSRRAELLLQQGNYEELREAIHQMHNSCKLPSGADDTGKSTYLMEVYALYIQLYNATNDTTSMKQVYEKVKGLGSAITDPRVMAVIYESFGLMHMREGEWATAYNELFDAFRQYQEAGHSAAKRCLRYVVLSNMVSLSDIDPFSSREAAVYRDDPEIQAMMTLRRAYEKGDMELFQNTLHNPKFGLLSDDVIKSGMAPLVHNFRCQVLLRLVKPYRCIRLAFISEALQISDDEAEQLVVKLILDGQLKGKINQLQACIMLDQPKADSKTYDALSTWTARLEKSREKLQSMLQRG